MDSNFFDGTMRLSDCTLKGSLESVYATTCAVLGSYGVPRNSHFFNVEVPGIVFDIAFGAGWIIIPGADEANATPRFHGATLVQLGSFTVERWCVDAFVDLLRDEIDFHSYGNEDTIKAQLAALPRFTSIAERQELIRSYIELHAENGKNPKIVDLANWSGVDYSDFKKWRRGPTVLPNSSAKAQRISMLLRHNDRNLAKKPRKS